MTDVDVPPVPDAIRVGVIAMKLVERAGLIVGTSTDSATAPDKAGDDRGCEANGEIPGDHAARSSSEAL
jgi:hypothetical protein